MATETAINLIERQDWLDKAGETLQPAAVEAFKAGDTAGSGAERIADLFCGWSPEPSSFGLSSSVAPCTPFVRVPNRTAALRRSGSSTLA